MADDHSFDPDDANIVAFGLANVVATASRSFGGYAMIGGVMKFNVDFIISGIENGEMDIRLVKMLKATHEVIANKLGAELQRLEKDVN